MDPTMNNADNSSILEAVVTPAAMINDDSNPLSTAFFKAQSLQHDKYHQLKKQNELKRQIFSDLLCNLLSKTDVHLHPPFPVNSVSATPSFTFQSVIDPEDSSSADRPLLPYQALSSSFFPSPIPHHSSLPFEVLQVSVVASPPVGVTAVVHLQNTSSTYGHEHGGGQCSTLRSLYSCFIVERVFFLFQFLNHLFKSSTLLHM